MPGDNFAFLLPVIMTIFGVVFVALGKAGIRHAWFWGAGFFCSATAFTLPHVTQPEQASTIVLVADALFISAFFFYGQALTSRLRSRQMLPLRLCVASGGFAIIVWCVLGLRSAAAELFMGDLICATLLAIAVILCIPRVKRPDERILLGAAALVVTETVVRMTVFSSDIPDSFENFATSGYAFVMQAVATIGALLLALSALLTVTWDIIDRYRDAAERDALTGLFNRRGLETAVDSLAAGNHTSIAIICCDIDHFKKINDTFGHASGDRVLQGISGIMRQTLPSSAQIARIGGEEFVALLPGYDMESGIGMANMLRLAIAGRNWSDAGVSKPVTASFGIDCRAPGDRSLHEAIGRADIGLYTAKTAGRNRVATKGSSLPSEPSIRLASGNA